MLLVLDEMGYTQLTPVQAQALFDLVLARYEHRATILPGFSRLRSGVAYWAMRFPPLLDRVLHHAEVIAINALR